MLSQIKTTALLMVKLAFGMYFRRTWKRAFLQFSAVPGFRLKRNVGEGLGERGETNELLKPLNSVHRSTHGH